MCSALRPRGICTINFTFCFFFSFFAEISGAYVDTGVRTFNYFFVFVFVFVFQSTYAINVLIAYVENTIFFFHKRITLALLPKLEDRFTASCSSKNSNEEEKKGIPTVLVVDGFLFLSVLL